MKISHKTKTAIAEILNSTVVLEQKGEYLQAFQLLKDFWDNENNSPNLTNVPIGNQAELFLRFGSLFGYIGDIKGIPSSQNRAKDLITEARNRFIDLLNEEKVAECENYLAITYLNINEIEEAEIWLGESFSHQLTNSNKTRLYSFIIKSILQIAKKEYLKIISEFKEIEEFFLKSKDSFLIGNFFNHLGIALDCFNTSPIALSMYVNAKKHFLKIGHIHYIGSIDNNLAQLYKSLKEYDKAHLAVDSAINIFDRAKNFRRKSVALDTKALIYLEENKLEQAIILNNECLISLKNSNSYLNIIECLFTKIKIQFALDQTEEASLTYAEAVGIAKQYSGIDFVQQLAKDFSNLLRIKFPYTIEVKHEKERLTTQETADISLPKNIPINLPRELSSSKRYHAVKLRYNDFIDYGLSKGTYLILDPSAEVKCGDFVSLEEDENSDAKIGFYDKEFGLVCIEKPSNDPEIFNQNEFYSIKKVVGYGEYDPTTNEIDVKFWNKKKF